MGIISSRRRGKSAILVQRVNKQISWTKSSIGKNLFQDNRYSKPSLCSVECLDTMLNPENLKASVDDY